MIWVDKDSAGSRKGHGNKFLSSHFQNFSWGGPPDLSTNIRSSLLQSWVSPDRFDLSLDPCLQDHRKVTLCERCPTYSKFVKTRIHIRVQNCMLNRSRININNTSKTHQIAPFYCQNFHQVGIPLAQPITALLQISSENPLKPSHFTLRNTIENHRISCCCGCTN